MTLILCLQLRVVVILIETLNNFETSALNDPKDFKQYKVKSN